MKRTRPYQRLFALAVLAMLTALCNPAQAQYDMGYTHYMLNDIFINPACAGTKEALSTTAMVRDQWSSFSRAPRTIMLNAHAPLANEKVGLGVALGYDQVGVTRQTSLYFDYAYRIHMKKGIWAMGLQGNVGYQNVNYGELQNLIDNYDPLLVATPSELILNLGVGTYYYTDRFHIGFSIPRMLNNDYIKGQNKKFDIADWTYYLQSGYTFLLDDGFQLMPSAMLKLTYAVRPQINVSFLSLMWDVLWLGADYRTDNTLAALAGFQLNNSFRLTYSYEMNLAYDTRRTLGGSHEVSLSYTMDIKKKKQNISMPHYRKPRTF